jgi:methylenetetrahydrofolate dehydrogenase (NADP+)/methenyltetrahydrofolate cyclohydrolase
VGSSVRQPKASGDRAVMFAPVAEARIIDGKRVAERVRAAVKADVERYVAEHGEAPGLATVLVGDDEASRIYVSGKQKACAEVGIRSVGHELPAAATPDEIHALIDELNQSEQVDGILLQLPLPDHVDASRLTATIDPLKDVDGLTPTNAGLLAQGNPALVPATPAGVIELLRASATPMEGAEAVIVGRSGLVGRPLASLLLAENATVTVCHSRTRDLPGTCRSADILVAATGSAGLITGDMVKPGATVIDVGITRTPDGLSGDVDFAAVSQVARAITPVPGGVGPMTIAMLLRNTLKAAESRRGNS